MIRRSVLCRPAADEDRGFEVVPEVVDQGVEPVELVAVELLAGELGFCLDHRTSGGQLTQRSGSAVPATCRLRFRP